MKKISYEVNGTRVEVEVTDEFAALYEQMDEEEKRVNRKETRRHQSLETLVEGGFQIADPDSDIEETLIKQHDIDQLHRALAFLTDDQKWLVEQVFYYGRKQSEIAAELGIDATSIRDRLRAIYKKVKKFFSK